MLDTWEHIRVEVERLIEVDDQTMVLLMTLSGKGRGSGIEVRQQIAHLDSFRAGKLTRIVTYTEHAEALEAAGLSE